MIQVTNLAQFKKALIVGRMINVSHYTYRAPGPDGKVNFGIEVRPTRPISIVQSNSYAIATEIEPGKVVDNWVTYPTAKGCTFEDNKLKLYANHSVYGNVLLSVYSFAENDEAPEVKPEQETELQTILSTPEIIDGNKCYCLF